MERQTDLFSPMPTGRIPLEDPFSPDYTGTTARQRMNATAERGAVLFSVPPVHAGLGEEDAAPFQRIGFSGEAGTGGEIRAAASETIRLLLDRAEETKEMLSGLNERADEIRRELTI